MRISQGSPEKQPIGDRVIWREKLRSPVIYHLQAVDQGEPKGKFQAEGRRPGPSSGSRWRDRIPPSSPFPPIQSLNNLDDNPPIDGG